MNSVRTRDAMGANVLKITTQYVFCFRDPLLLVVQGWIAPTSIFEIIPSILRNVTVVVQKAKKDN